MPTLRKRRLSLDDMRSILAESPDGIWDTLIETGTYRAETTLLMAKLFFEVHSIELSEQLYKEAVEKCAEAGYVKSDGEHGIYLYHGNSVNVLPLLNFGYPLVYFLDAHACKTKPMVTAHTFPLWEELDFICSRPHHDIIIIDDVHTFGEHDKRSEEPRWEEVTFDSIVNYIGVRKFVQRSKVVDDTFVVYV